MRYDVGSEWRGVRSKVSWMAGVLLASFAAAAFAAKGPPSEKAVPIFPGAKEMADPGEEPETGDHIRSAYVKRYTTRAMPEEVFAFYRQRFSPKAAIDDETQPPRGKTSEVALDLNYHSFEDMMSKGEGEAQRAMLRRSGRKPHAPDKWISIAYFQWTKTEPNGDRSEFQVAVWDGGHEGAGGYEPETQITVKRTTYKSEAAMADEEEQADEREFAARVRRLAGSSFGAADVGLPEYPGARKDAETTHAIRTSMGADAVAYRTKDPVERVAAFYQKQRGLRPMGPADKQSAGFQGGCKEQKIPLLKQTIVTGCDVQVTIQNPWMNPKTGKLMSDTLITIVRGGE